MQGDLGRPLRDSGPRPGLGQAQAGQLDVADQDPLAVRQTGEGPIQFQTDAGIVFLGRKKGLVILDRQGLSDLAAPPVVDQLVTRHGMRPGGKRLGSVPGRPLDMHGQQRFLHQILHISRRTGHPARKIGA